MGMAVSMAAMMAPTAAPFFFAYGRDARRAAGVATVFVIYVATWAAIGLGVDFLMSQLMVPSSWVVTVVAIALAAAYTVTPWSRWARARCREMCCRALRGGRLRDAVSEGLAYTACCAVCSAGVMGAVLVLGMTDVVVVVVAAAVMLAVKVTPGPSRRREA